MRRSRLAGGLVVLLIGVMFLLANMGYLDMSVWALVGRFWPALLVIGGVMLLLGVGFRWFLVVLLAALIVLGTIGGPIVYGWATGPLTNAVYVPDPDRTDVTELRVEMHLDVPMMRVLPPTSTLYRVQVGYRSASEPQVSLDVRDGTGFLTVRQALRPQTYVLSGAGTRQNVEFGFRNDLPVELWVKTGVTSTNLDLRAYDLRRMDFDTGVGNVVMRLGAPTGTVPVNVTSGVGNVELYVPRNTAVRVTADAGVGARDIGQIGNRSGDTWTDDSFGGATDRLDIRVSAGVGRVSVKRY